MKTIPAKEKVCTQCKKGKPLGEFNKDSQNEDGTRSYCRICQSKYGKGYFKEYNATPSRKAKQALYRAKSTRRQAEQHMGITIFDDLKSYDVAMVQSEIECIYCEKDLAPGEATIDHVKTFAAGGINEYRNLLPACKSCNSRKRNMPVYTFLSEHCNEYSTKQVVFRLAQRQLKSYSKMLRELMQEADEYAKEHAKEHA